MIARNFTTDHTAVAQAPSGRWAVIVRKTIDDPWKQVSTRPDFALARDEALAAEADYRVRNRLYDANANLEPANWGADAPNLTIQPTPDATLCNASANATPKADLRQTLETRPAQAKQAALEGKGSKEREEGGGGGNLRPLGLWPFAGRSAAIVKILTSQTTP